MPLVRAQVVLAHKSGLPKDQVVNTFHFFPDGLTTPDLEGIAADLVNFYDVVQTGETTALRASLSSSISIGPHTIRLYEIDMATGENQPYSGAPPIYTTTFSFGAAPAVQGYPAEVALVLTQKNLTGATPGGGNFNTPQAQRRGRIYFGPIASNAGTVVSNVLRPDPGIIQKLNASGKALMGSLHNWVVYSRPFAGRSEVVRPGRTTLPALPARNGQAYLIQQVSVDNAFDTQRRRGEAASARTIAS